MKMAMRFSVPLLWKTLARGLPLGQVGKTRL